MTPGPRSSRVHMLIPYAACSTVLLLAVVLMAATSERRAAFDEIDVERINVRKPDGRLSLVILNETRMPGVISGGQEYGPKKGRSGLVFYDGGGDEMGGLTFGSRIEDGALTHSGHLAFDARGNDQGADLSYSETWEGGEQTSRVGGLRFIDRAPSGPEDGRTRLEMGAAEDGRPDRAQGGGSVVRRALALRRGLVEPDRSGLGGWDGVPRPQRWPGAGADSGDGGRVGGAARRDP